MALRESTSPVQSTLVGAERVPAVPLEPTTTARAWAPRIATIGALILGGVFAYSLPAVSLEGGATLNLSEVSTKVTFQGDGWVFTLTWFAAVLAIVAALVFPHAERFAQTLAITFGSILAMAFPFYVSRNLERIDQTATSIGSGLILAWLSFAAAAALPWASLLWINRTDPVLGRNWEKWLFLLPAISWILLLTVFPLAYAITTSRYVFRNGRISRFVGWDNYRRLFERELSWQPLGTALLYALIAAAVILVAGIVWTWLNDREVTGSDVKRTAGILPVVAIPVFVVTLLPGILRDPLNDIFSYTLFFVVCAVTAEMTLGLLLALLMNREMRARGALRAVLTLPLFAAPVGIGYLGRTIFYEEGGPVNQFLRGIGLPGYPWLSNPLWSRISTVIVDVWQWTPFVFVIALAGLQALPQDIIEASEVDGANWWQGFRHITLPLLAPILWLILLLRTIDAFKVFDIAASMTVGGPGRATEYYSLFNYRTARKFFNYGEAAAQAFLLLFIVALLITVLWTRIRHVYEEGETRA